MHVTPLATPLAPTKGAAVVSDRTALVIAAASWIVATAWIMDRITASMYDAAYAVIKTAAAAAGGG